jgi:RimJ/RimL family protein N-acetyltransferase
MKYLLEGVQTKRLYFRKVVHGDFNDWLPFFEDPRSTQYWEGAPQDPVTACLEQFQRTFERYDEGSGGLHALVCTKDEKLIGLGGLLVQVVDGLKALEVGYSILPKYWGLGYATEAAKHCMKVAFANNWCNSLIAIIHRDNLPSQKVALNNGMQKEKEINYKNNPVFIYGINKP